MTATNTDRPGSIVGHGELIELMRAVINGKTGAPTAVVLVGQAGIGKSTLLLHALASAGDDVLVLHIVGAAQPGSTYLPLVDLLWPVHEFATEVPPALRGPLTELFQGEGPVTSTPSLITHAVLALLHAAAASRPVLLVVDDVDQFDYSTSELLLGVASSLIGPRVRAVMTVRRRDVLVGVDRVVHTVAVAPLTPGQSAELLDRQTHQPDQSVRGELVRWSRGNPLALIEYASAYAHNGGRRFHGPTMTDGGAAHHPVFVNQIAGLPADTRTLLLHAAAAVGSETVDAITEAAGFGADFSHWQPACAAEVVAFTDDGHVDFANALVRAAAYADDHLGMRRAAHVALAAAPGLEKGLRAWHLAAAASGPDESIAAALEEAALASRGRGMDLQLARSLQRAAEMSPHHADAARRYSLAASAANFGGDLAWALSLTEIPFHEADDPDVVGHAAFTRASIYLQSSRPTDAADVVRSVLDGNRPNDAHLVLTLMYAATNAAYYSGQLQLRRDLRRWLDDLSAEPIENSRFPLPLPAGVADVQRAYVAMYADAAQSYAARPRIFDRQLLRSRSPTLEPSRRLVTGAMAYACQDTATAVSELTGALDQCRELGGLRGFTYALAPLAWSLLDTGRWTDLQHVLDEAELMSAVQPLTLMDREVNACRAQWLAMRGDAHSASAALSGAWAITAVAAAPACATEVALHRAAGWTAVASGDFATAYRQFRAMFLDDAEPAHFVVSHVGIADLAWAAARSNQAEDVRPLVDAVARQLGEKPPTRLRLLLHQAIALTTTTDAAEHHYKLAVFDPAGEEWPVERARAAPLRGVAAPVAQARRGPAAHGRRLGCLRATGRRTAGRPGPLRVKGFGHHHGRV